MADLAGNARSTLPAGVHGETATPSRDGANAAPKNPKDTPESCPSGNTQ